MSESEGNMREEGMGRGGEDDCVERKGDGNKGLGVRELGESERERGGGREDEPVTSAQTSPRRGCLLWVRIDRKGQYCVSGSINIPHKPSASSSLFPL